jgi:putative colanic acid biosynthesis acetyltransferase WcaF
MERDDDFLSNDRVAVPVINLANAPGERDAWNRPRHVIYGWAVAELLFVTNPWQISSSLRARVLRRFGAEIGSDVILRPRMRVKFPWNLRIGDRSWIGEGVWIHNQDFVTIENDAVVSQESFLTTGSHTHRLDMGLVTRPITVEAGVWITSRCIILGGVTVGRSALITPGTVVSRDVPANAIFGAPSATVVGSRFMPGPAKPDAGQPND